MRLLALDQSLSNTGWALWDEGEEMPRSGAWPLCSGLEARALGFRELSAKLRAIQEQAPITAIAYEQPLKLQHDKVEALKGTYGLIAAIEIFASRRSIPVEAIDIARWRASYLGAARKGKKGEALKKAAMDRGRDFGFALRSHDEAEALGILDHMMHKRRIMPPWREAALLVPT